MRSRLVVAMVAVVAVVLLVHDVPLARHLEDVERDRLITKYERDAFIIAGRTEEAVVGGTFDPTLNAVVTRYGSLEDVDVVITNEDAIGVMASDSGKVEQNLDNRPEIVEAIATGDPQVGDRYSETLGETLVFVAVPVFESGRVVGAVRIAVPASAVSAEVNERLRGLVLVAGLSLLIAGVAAWLFARTVSTPLQRLAATNDEFAAGELSVRADAGEGPSEVRALGGSFNSMAARIEQLVERQRAFAGTASHQLRTPLTAIRIRLEQVADGVAGTEQELAVENAIVETERLGRMIEGLLALTRAEDAALGPVAVDIADLVDERIEFWSALANERQVTISAGQLDHARALAVPGAVEQIIDNYVDNALEVSPPGGTIEVAVYANDDLVELHVIDAGPGLELAERQRAFERFWRAGGAADGGSGLGLAIVQQLCAASGGRAELRAAPTGGIDAVAMLLAAER